jgi:hypothetical protein
MEKHAPGISRRTIVKGAAWSVPVVAVAVATPLAAASTTPLEEEFDFFLTAGQVIGNASATGQVRSNGVRISPADPQNPKVVAAGTMIRITLTYTGSNPAFDFRNTPYGIDWMKAQNQAWTIDPVEAGRIVFTAVTSSDSSEPTIGSMSWILDPAVRPEDDSIRFSGIAVIAPGGDFPAGGTISNLVVDPNGGTGALTGPTQETWPA